MASKNMPRCALKNVINTRKLVRSSKSYKISIFKYCVELKSGKYERTEIDSTLERMTRARNRGHYNE